MMKKEKFGKKRRTFFAVVALVVFVIGVWVVYDEKVNFDFQITKEMIAEQEEFQLKNATNFSWDSAYLDRDNYDKASAMKEKYHFKGHVHMNLHNTQTRIIFVRNGRIVKTTIIEDLEILFPDSLELFEPDAVFQVHHEVVNWPDSPYNGKTRVVLTIKK
jgi:hypothetical protein